MAQQVPPPENSCAPRTRAQWRLWLERHHDTAEGIWVVAPRKGVEASGLAHEAIVGEALCFGWVDGRTRSLDAGRRLVWVAPRRAGTGWSRADKERVKRLVDEGRMAAPGAARVKAAKRDGSWTLLDDVEAMVVPPDLSRALAAHGSTENFQRLAPSKRRIALEWIDAAKRPITRAARVEETARLAKMDIVMTQWRFHSRR